LSAFSADDLACDPGRNGDVGREQGLAGFTVHASPSRPPKPRALQQRRLVKALVADPLAGGYASDLWATPRTVEPIRKRFKTSYHPDHAAG
jgi:hypothetical protein